MEWPDSPMKMLELERTATLRPFQSSKYCGSLHGFSRSVEREHRCRYAVADRGQLAPFRVDLGSELFPQHHAGDGGMALRAGHAFHQSCLLASFLAASRDAPIAVKITIKI